MMSRFFYSLIITFFLMMSVPVSGVAAAISASIVPGLNVTGVTAAQVSSQATAFPLLALWKPSGVTAIESYNAASGTLLRAELDTNGNPSGSNFTLVENSALYVYSTQANTLSLGASTFCSPLTLTAGFNLVGHACFPADYSASQFITSVGIAAITSISRLDLPSGRWQTAAVDNGTIVGEDFLLTAGEGYIIQAVTAVSGWKYPSLALTPTTMAVWQGQTGAALTVTIPAPAPLGGMLIDVTSSDSSLVTAASVSVPQGATSVDVPLTLPDTGISSVQAVTIMAARAGMNSAQATLSVRPKPTINLSPLTTLTGLTFTYLLTVNLSDIAPPGGFPVTLASAPAGIVSVPASVTIPAGARSTQVTVTATAVGSAVISASSPGKGVTGATGAVTVTPIQTMNYGPITTAPVGVVVALPATTGRVDATYGPFASVQVGVVVGSVMTGITPPTGATGSTNMKVTVSGVGLSAATAMAFYPPDDITIQPSSFTIVDGNPQVTINIGSAAITKSQRTVIVTLPSGVALPAAPGANQFRVTLPEPQILSMQPIRAMVGQVVSLNIFGKNFTSATSINFTPDTGMAINNPPTINAAGDMATVTVNIDATAPLGNRVVTISTPGWTSSATATVANTFQVTADAGTTYTPLLSREVGILVQPLPQPNSQDMTYGPIVSGQVGVVVGSVMTGITPPTGATGSTNMTVMVSGVGLSAATALAFNPPDGITIKSFAIVDGNPQVTVDIDPTAITKSQRTVVVTLPSGAALPAVPGANQFRVTLPEPQILSMQPIRAMVGQALSLNLFGKNFTSATSINFTPDSGISINNPPTINAAGDMATVTVNIAASAPLGNRVVTITTPGWTSNAAASVANTFQVTADAGVSYTPLVSREVGVMVSELIPINSRDRSYGPVVSGEVGVMVTQPSAATEVNVNYTPILSTQVGVAVGGVLTGIAPLSVEPGTTTTVTLTGTSLNSATAIKVVPDLGVTIGTWTAAPDGLSGTVVITTSAAIAVGQKTVVVLTSGGTIMPAVPGAGTLLVGYRPLVNSISPLLPTVGTTFTLTINGIHLQGASKVEILPSGSVIIDSPPQWVNDATGEHLTVKVIIDGAAVPGDRVVVITTPYGVTTPIGSPANTITLFKPGVAQLAQPVAQRIAVVRAEALFDEPAQSVRAQQRPDPPLTSPREKPLHRGGTVIVKRTPLQLPLFGETPRGAPMAATGYLYAGYRGPPGALESQESTYFRRIL